MKGYTDAHYKAFDSHVGAIDWLRKQRSITSVQNMMRQHNAEAAQSACDTNNTADVIDRNQLVGQIFIQPARAVEFIVLDFVVQPTGATFN